MFRRDSDRASATFDGAVLATVDLAATRSRSPVGPFPKRRGARSPASGGGVPLSLCEEAIRYIV